MDAEEDVDEAVETRDGRDAGRLDAADDSDALASDAVESTS